MSKFFDLNIKILKLSGLWVPDSGNRSYRLAVSYNIFWVMYSMVYFTLAELIALKESASNLNDLITNLNMLMSFILTLIKVIVWFKFRKDILEIMKSLESCEDTFQDYNINSNEIILNEKRFKDMWTKTFFVVSTMVPTSAGILSITEEISSGDRHVSFRNGTGFVYSQRLPYYSWIPFDHTASKYTFGIAVFSQCIALLNCGYITVGLDMMFVALISFLTTHFNLIKEAMKRIKKTCTKRIERQVGASHTEQVLSAECEKEIKKCVKHLQVLIGLRHKLETIYSFVVLMQVLISLVVLCTCLYLVSLIPIGVRLLGNELSYLLAIEIQVAVYCYVGDRLTHSALEIPTAIYTDDWLTASSSFKKILIITMMRMQKPIYITIGKFSPLSLTTFLMIGKTSYSIFTMLKTVN